MLRLVTIPISHYCEKARWALDRAGIPYREERHVQGLHRIYSRRAGGAGTVPVLVTPDGALGESAEILAWADRGLEPDRRLAGDGAHAAEVAALCRRLDDVLGPRGRRLIYVRMFEQPELMLRFNNQGVPRWEDRAVRLALPVAKRFISGALGITPGIEHEDEAAVFGELDWIAGILADGRPYLAGERFTAADLTFAALAAPVVLPPRYGVRLPPKQLLDAPTTALVDRARAHPAGAFALRMVETERGPGAVAGALT
jgi:glutathione S-transferase